MAHLHKMDKPGRTGHLTERSVAEASADRIGRLSRLPQEICDHIFGHFTTQHAVAVDIIVERELRKRYRFPSRSFRTIIALDATISLVARQINKGLRSEYQAALRTFIKKHGTRKVLLLPAISTPDRREILHSLNAECRPAIIFFPGPCCYLWQFVEAIEELIEELDSYSGSLDIRVIIDERCSPCDIFSSRRSLHDWSTDKIDITLRCYTTQAMHHEYRTKTAAPKFTRLIESDPKYGIIIRGIVREGMPQLICAILGQHDMGAAAVASSPSLQSRRCSEVLSVRTCEH